ARAGLWLVHLPAAAGVLPRVAENIRVAKAIRNRIPPHGSAVHSPAQSLLARFPRNYRWVHASQGTRLFREQSPCGARATELRRGEPEKIPRVWTALLGCERQRRSRTREEDHRERRSRILDVRSPRCTRRT